MYTFYRRHIMPFLVDWALDRPLFRRLRADLLAPLEGEVLEIGIGTGLNLPHYPSAVQTVHAVDPNPGGVKRLRRRAGPPVRFHEGGGERLPFEDHRFHWVVSTWTMCSIADLDGALREIRRVLAPGGALLFLEHGAHPDERVCRWQRRLDPVQKVIGDGCHLSRGYFDAIENAGLKLEKSERFCIDKMSPLVQTHYRGLARNV